MLKIIDQFHPVYHIVKVDTIKVVPALYPQCKH